MNPGDSPLGYTPRSEPLGAPAAPVSPPPAPQYGILPVQPLTAAPPKRGRRTGLIVALIAAAVVLLAGGGVTAWALFGRGTSPASPAFHSIFDQSGSAFTVNGTFTILGGCGGFGYSDIQSGTQVVLTDEKGTTIGVGSLVSGGGCYWTFTIKDVPPGHPYYGVTVSHRGTIQYTETQLRAGIQLSLGG